MRKCYSYLIWSNLDMGFTSRLDIVFSFYSYKILTLPEKNLSFDVSDMCLNRRTLASMTDDDKKKDFNLEEFQMRAGHKMKDMLKACKWRDIKCTSDDFTPVRPGFGSHSDPDAF